MEYERRVIDAAKGIVRVTFPDERWYEKTVEGKTVWIPSVTWITSYWPKGVGFMKWMASHGFNEAEAIKEAAGEKGTKVHQAVEMLLAGETVDFQTTIADERSLTAEEYGAVLSFVEWHQEYKPIVKKTEMTVFAPDDMFAGTLDLWCEIKGEDWIIDFKTSSDIWPSHEIQIMAYRYALGIEAKIAILQLGYKRNKTKKWKLTEVQYDFSLFQAAYRIWQKEVGEIQPLQREYPTSLKLTLRGKEK